ncbi:Mediator of replication checkpoint protein 1 [Madurella mycetomatis]|uniref:Mediator of replication checkpoint protein 1 n=1 Tax=Madurella mycetomatis TaxID=100816 RepID=A0A175VX56_9PEZI|nr:Mediator of replication checkpoint protein 1 [Madurella mycetomatis]
MASSPSSAPAPHRSRSATPTPTRTTITQNPFAALSDSSSEDDEILRPRGKIASRMQVRDNVEQECESEAEDNAAAARNSSPRRNGRDSPSAANQNDSGDDGNDEVLATRPRKLMARRQRRSTPETMPQETAPSPGLFVSPEKNTPTSPGLFVSPSRPHSPSTEGAPTSPAALTKNPRFLALVAKKRQERLAREAEEARKKAERQKAADYHDYDDIVDEDDEENITDDEGGRKLTQEAGAARPARKASKKALEEMNRETQRLSRSLQLAHEAKATLFERFSFKLEGAAAPVEKSAPTSSSRAPTPGSAQQSDSEMKDVETPPSSPPLVGKDADAAGSVPVPAEPTPEEDEELASLEEAFETAAASDRLDKGKSKAAAADLDAPKQSTADLPQGKRNLRVKLPTLQANTATLSFSLDDDDDDLQVQPAHKSKIDAIFERVPLKQAKEPRSLQILRKLAHLDDPDKKASAPAGKQTKQQQPAMTVGELQANLLQRARVQAKLERDRHLEMLRAKGIHVQTAEEREKEMQQVEDIVAKARKEAEEIMRKEREAAKKDRKAKREAGEDDPLAWDDSDDEEYEEVNEEQEVAEFELSGSEEEGEGEDNEEADPADGVFDEAAESTEESEADDTKKQAGDGESDEDGLPNPKQVRRKPRKQVTILSDDEEDGEPLVKATPRPKANHPKSPSASNADSPSVPTSVLRSATKTFIPGLPVAGPAGLGLTQIFAGTMDDSQMGTGPADTPSQPRPTFDVNAFPDSNFSQAAQEAAEDMILDSQPSTRRETQDLETQAVQLRISQSQMHGFDTFLEENQNATQMSELIEPTQDGGFRNFSPLRQRFVDAPVSTVATVPAGQSQVVADQNESPLVRRTGKLRRRPDIVPASPTRRTTSNGEDDTIEELETDEFGFGTVSSNAFTAMKEAALKEKKRKEAFDKKKSKAREMVEEQAEESEDEYAGLGGADGEDSSDDDDHSVKEMIDDETKNNEVDERKLAAFYADRERASDEKEVEKLFHDITTGMLRRKRAGNWDDLSDSDDGGEARRRMKRRQFAKMQRALFADERISKVAENPRNQAFLRTIEDRGSDDEMDFIFAPPPGVEHQDSQSSASAASGVTIPASQPIQTTSRNPRRTTKEGKKPSNLGEIRESLSNLLDEPLNSSVIPATEVASSSEDEDEDEDDSRSHSSNSGNSSSSSNKENRNPRRNHNIVDRINLKRNASTASSANRLAFATTSSTGAGSGTFKVPALLRRATTNSLLSTSSSSSRTSTASTTRADESMKIKKTACKRSGVSYLARENERRAAVAEKERRREERKWRGAEGRVKAVGGLFGSGRFE